MKSTPGLLLLLLMIAPSVHSQPTARTFRPDSVQKAVQAVAIEKNLTVDGLLSETEWRQARPVADFRQIDPVQGGRPRSPTEVRVLFNRKYLYIAAINYDSLGSRGLRAPDFRRDFNPGGHDYFGLSLDGFNDRRNAMAFLTNPFGTQRDLIAFDDVLTDLDWDALWRVRTSRTDTAWVAEIAIPWQTLRYARTTDSTADWGINFFRNRRSINELSAWSPFPRAFSPNRMAYAGRLTGLKPPPPSTNLRVQPYLLFAGDSGPEHPGSVRRSLKTGGDLKWAINPNAVLDLTFHTDFAQADVDRQVNNLSRLSVFFPERRAFFLENASLFGAGLAPDFIGYAGTVGGGSMVIRPFFSRTIGLATRPDGTGIPIPIAAGARFVYRSARQNFGGLLMRQRPADDGPATDFMVGRYSRNLGSQNRIGGLITLKNRQAGAGEARQNGVGAVDGFFRINNSLSYQAMAVASASAGHTGRGFAGYSQFYYRSNQLVAWLTQSVVSKGFSPEMGFVSRSDVLAHTPGFYAVNRGRWLPARIREFDPGMYVEVYHKLSTGRLQEGQVILSPVWFMFQNGGFFGLFAKPAFQRLDPEDVRPLNLKLASTTYRYLRFAFALGNDPSGKVAYQLIGETGGYYDGRMANLQGQLRLSPVPQVSVTAAGELSRFRAVGADRFSRTIGLYSLECRLALNPRLQVIGFYQRNTYTATSGRNIRFSWEFKPLSFVYLIYNQGYSFSDFGVPQRERHLIGKISYLKQF
ncbi:carbohydrate binding family 9 domain-containing protein [Larkinella soli]|uniref:carbohydrate binding family 9 domain-containing protein n=1 Tax=Larkinella soli TaxID=1770527 RepID=UPI000FFC3586|nr:carbohydrate binding family 9 domain-containing protein [Larkinella soli]